MASGSKSILPSPAQLKNLSDDKARMLMEYADRVHTRSTNYALSGLICGTISLLACLAMYSFLVVRHFDKAAGLVLGTAVLAVIGAMIRTRR